MMWQRSRSLATLLGLFAAVSASVLFGFHVYARPYLIAADSSRAVDWREPTFSCSNVPTEVPSTTPSKRPSSPQLSEDLSIPENRFKHTRAAMNERCKKFQEPLTEQETKRLYSNLVVDDKHRVIYCPVWKVGTTSWRAVMLILKGLFPDLDTAIKKVYGLRDLNTLISYKNQADIEFRLKNYTKFMPYREPLNRFTAAYLMFHKADRSVYNKMCQTVVKYADSVRGHRDPLHPWNNMSIWDFGEYVSRFGNDTDKLYGLNTHWLPMSLACHPCHVNYDYYIDMESPTVADDVKYLLKTIGAPRCLQMPHENPTRTDKNSFLSQLPEALYQRLLSVYYNDYEIFGHKRRDWNRLKE